MAEIVDELDRASDVIEKERREIRDLLGKDAEPERVNEALRRIERTLYSMNVRIKEGKFDLSGGSRFRIEDLVRDIDNFRQVLINQRSRIEVHGMDMAPNELMKDVEDGYERIIGKYVSG